MDDYDRKLFLKYLHILNDADIESPSRNFSLHLQSQAISKRLTNICAFCLMPNHFHLVLYECRPGGISKLLQRLGTAFTMYFNEKYERSGALFQGGFKSRLIEDEAYLMQVIDYLHLNPIQHKEAGGARKTLSKSDMTLLDEYPWSSFNDYCGKKTYPNILQRDVLNEHLEMPKDYRAWLFEQYDFEDIRPYTIDL